MIKKIKKGLAVLAAAAVMAGCLTGCAPQVDPYATVATLGDESIDMGVMTMYMRRQQAQIYNTYTMNYGMFQIFDTVYDEETFETFGEGLKEDLLETFEQMCVLRAHAEELGVTLTEEETAEINAAAAAFVADNDPEVLEAIGTTEEHIAELLGLYTYQIKMEKAMVESVDKEVSDEEAAQSKVTYVRFSLEGTETDGEGNRIPLTEDEMEAIRDNAETLLTKISEQEDVASADMDALAKEVDESLSAVEFTYDEEGYLDEAVYAAIQGLKEGELLDEVVMSNDGTALYVVRFDAELDREATDAEKENIIAQREQEIFEAELEKWMEASDFQVVEKVWKKISLNDTQVFNFVVEETETEETAETEEAAE